MSTIPTEIWAAVGGADRCVHHACTWAAGCHEHINDAIAEHDIEDAKQWTVRRYVLPDWQPIKTAPRDGTNILLAWGQDGVSQGHYIPGLPHPWKFIDTNDGLTWLINHAVDGPGGPTHWQPMPLAVGVNPSDQPQQKGGA